MMVLRNNFIRKIEDIDMTDRIMTTTPALINEDKTPMQLPPSEKRFYALDALRASALLLGVVFHSVLAYVMQPGEWAIGTLQTNMPLWWFVHTSHGFRMEVFFLLSGFYACLVIQKRGTASFLRNRAIRIALVFILLLYPMKLLVSIPWISGGLKTGWMKMPSDAANIDLTRLAIDGFFLETWPNINLVHLWFLYYLAWISVIFVAIRWLIMKLTRADSLQLKMERGFYKLLSSNLAPLWIALPVVPVLALTPRYILESPDSSLVLDPAALLIYGFFFTIGWWLRKRSELLDIFAKRWKVLISLSVIASSFAFYCELQRVTVGGGAELMWMASIANAFTLSLAVLGWIGFFVSVFNNPSPITRYIADSSYWVYLIHLPIIITLQVMVSDWSSVVAKILFINVVTFAITMLSYEYLVRYTWIGRWLNGQRHIRSV
jgi:peptidoglycan/LPS O-acetylase OafA/YrhL